MRLAAKKDANHNAIAATFEALGCSVLDLSRVGRGCPDILVGFPHASILVEIKTTTGKLEDTQLRFIRDWVGPVEVCRSEQEAIALVQKYRARLRA